MDRAEWIARGLEDLETELGDVIAVLRESIPVPAGGDAFEAWLDAGSDTGRSVPVASDGAAEAAIGRARLHAIAFELLNMVEERVGRRFRDARRQAHGPAGVRGLWHDLLVKLRDEGFREPDVLAVLRDFRIEPVLTAHPTEAKHPSVRERLVAVYEHLHAIEPVAGRPSPLRRGAKGMHPAGAAVDDLRAALEVLWFTGEIHLHRPSITDELRNALHYLREIFPPLVLANDRSLEEAWTTAGWDPEALRAAGAWPRVRFGLWIGGDRDGHPMVTPATTGATLAELRRHALRLHARELRSAADALTLSTPAAEPPAPLLARLESLADDLGERGHRILATNRTEPWRALLHLVRQRVRRAEADPDDALTVDEVRADLELASATLVESGAHRTARSVVAPLLRLLDVFGLHLARLDSRQNSSAHDRALAELLEAAGVPDGAGFAGWPEAERREVLARELAQPRSLTAPGAPTGEAATAEIAALQVLATHLDRRGRDGLGLLIVSMTRDLSDLLAVHVLAREAGLAKWTDGGWVARLPVCPLFERTGDLAEAPRVVAEYLATPQGRSERLAGSRELPVMIGYSDSNKDGGILASQWSLARAQREILDACRRASPPAIPAFFHGRGGTISRGAGPIDAFLHALPHGAMGDSFRLTEQGEVVPQKYAYPTNARYHIELLTAGAVAAAVRHRAPHPPGAGDHPVPSAIIERLSEYGRATYRELIETPGFIGFHRSVTPIDALETGYFGSRPSRRTGASTFDDLRAIPWVFSWTQSRFYLPGWFGVGSALQRLEREDPESFATLVAGARRDPFLDNLFHNVETNLASASEEIMRLYASLAGDSEIAGQLVDRILAEFHLARTGVARILPGEFADRRPRLARTLALRERPLEVLHRQQVEILRAWRAQTPAPQGEGAREPRTSGRHSLELALQLTVTAIASGLRTTG